MALPPLFLDRIQHILPAGRDLTGYFRPPQHAAFRVNTLKASSDDIWQFLASEGLAFERIGWYSAAFTVSAADARRLLDSPPGMQGKIYAQGLESMLPAIVLDPKPGQWVLDLCAAPGSKTTQIAAHMNNEGLLIANEPVAKRFYRLRSVVELMGAKVQLLKEDGRYLRRQASFDRILVDAPCSSEGRFCHDDEEGFGYWSLRKIHEMAHKQKGLLLNAARLLKPGGVLVYSTCTFAPEENEAAIDWVLRKDTGLKIAAIELPGIPNYPALRSWNDRPFAAAVAKTFRVLPDAAMQGFFMAKLIRS